jgi:ABC-type branched-subunit amino acid transport system substrate-binding protein
MLLKKDLIILLKKIILEKILIAEKYEINATDVKTQLFKIKSKSPPAVYFIGYESGYISAINQFRELNLNVQCFGNSASLVFLKQLGTAVNGCYYTSANFNVDSKDKYISSFVDKYRSRYNKDPNYVSAIAYDSLYILKENIEKEGSILENLNLLLNHKGPLGEINTAPNGDFLVPVVLGQIKDGVLVLIN